KEGSRMPWLEASGVEKHLSPRLRGRPASCRRGGSAWSFGRRIDRVGPGPTGGVGIRTLLGVASSRWGQDGGGSENPPEHSPNLGGILRRGECGVSCRSSGCASQWHGGGGENLPVC